MYKQKFTLSAFSSFVLSLFFSYLPVHLIKPLGSKCDLEVLGGWKQDISANY